MMGDPLDDLQAQPIKTISVSAHENTLIYFEGIIETFGTVRIQTYTDEIAIWVGGEIVKKIKRFKDDLP